MMALTIQIVIYMYAVICLGLVTYSMFYNLLEKKMNRLNNKQIIFWEEAINDQCKEFAKGSRVQEKHKEFLCKRLINVNELIAFQSALQKHQKEQTDKIDDYIIEITSVFLFLSIEYGNKEDMEKSYLAYVVSIFWPHNIYKDHRISDILLSYLINTTVYCRENVLQALYSIGNIRAVENALRILNDYEYFHHYKLLADGLITFSGDKNALAEVLWRNCKEWDERIVIAIIQFITMCDADFTEAFWETMNNSNVEIEIRLAIIRYYKKHYYEPARDKLYLYVEESNDKNLILGIVATSALVNYPGEITVTVLKKALMHNNWHIRRNAAIALINLGITDREIDEILNGDDVYASEMLSYSIRTMGINHKERAVKNL